MGRLAIRYCSRKTPPALKGVCGIHNPSLPAILHTPSKCFPRDMSGKLQHTYVHAIASRSVLAGVTHF